MQILNSPKFKEEYKKISDFLNTTEDENKKLEVKQLLQELVSNVKKIDISHSDIIVSGKLHENASEARRKIFETRKKIYKIIGINV
jgi:predicted metal-dependent enzyme (double-stranded beta helix superfamily)